MFAVIYRWRIKRGLEQQFIENWAEVTKYYRQNDGALGSRLHRGSDGLFYAYAQWESIDQREKAFENVPQFEAREKMREAIDESLPEIRLEMVGDFLILPEKS